MQPSWPGVIGRFGPRMELPVGAEPVTLLEGGAPLIPAPTLSRELGCDLFLKYEGLNPTGSFKDRGMTVAITVAKHEGATAVVCASTGNTAASAAAYAARAGMTCFVVVPDGKIALGKLAGAIAYGAKVLALKGSFDDALRLVREACDRTSVALVNSLNPARLEGQKTAAFEIVDDLGAPPDWLCLPVGNAGNISAYWMGFCQEVEDGRATSRPQILGAQAAGSAPILAGRPIERPETIATAIRIGNPARWTQALDALRESNGQIYAVEDVEILSAYSLLATKEGVFCEPSSAAGLAGLLRATREHGLDVRGRRVVCVLTGHGLKDPDTAMIGAAAPRVLDASIGALLAEMTP